MIQAIIYAQRHKLSSGRHVTMETQLVTLKMHNELFVANPDNKIMQILFVFNCLDFKIRNDINSLISIVIDYLLNGLDPFKIFEQKPFIFSSTRVCSLID